MLNEKESSIEDLATITSKILNQYKEGIRNIIISPSPEQVQEPSFVLLMKCPSSFYEKYNSINNENNVNEILNDPFNSNKDSNLHLNEYNLIPLIEPFNEKLLDETVISDQYKKDLIEWFEGFDIFSVTLIEQVINKYLESESKKYILYEDLILLFCSILSYFSGLHIHIAFINRHNYFILQFYGNEDVYDHWAEYFEYTLQLKPFAYLYVINSKDKTTINTTSPLLTKSILNKHPIYWEDRDINNPIYWPPYFHFNRYYKNIFRQYKENDEYHDVFNEEKHDSIVSKFRAIDKLRWIYSILDYLWKFSYLKKKNIISFYTFHKNYQSEFPSKYIQPNTLNIWNFGYHNKRIHFFRNFFGEEVTFYFLWYDYLILWWLFPSALSLLMFLFNYLKYSLDWSNELFGLAIEEIVWLLFAIINSIWATLFYRTWIQQEKLYSYIWGTKDDSRQSIWNENFKPSIKQELIFGYYTWYDNTIVLRLKKFVSWIFLICMIVITWLIVFLIFQIKNSFINGIIGHDYYISLFIGLVNGVHIYFMKNAYRAVSKRLNNWENHYKLTSKYKSWAIKYILFDFMNSYSGIFYIAFYKPYYEGCVNGNCFKEIEVQLYSIFIIYFWLFFIEIGVPLLARYRNKEYWRQVDTQNQNQEHVQNMQYWLTSISFSSIHEEYSSLIIWFGYVLLFSVVAPLTPVIVFLLAFIGRLVDNYKFINLVRIDLITKSSGIGIYNNILLGFIFIGSCINISMVLFLRRQDLGVAKENNGTVFWWIENLMILMILNCKWNIWPKWFQQLKTWRDWYMKKYVFTEHIISNLKFKEVNKII